MLFRSIFVIFENFAGKNQFIDKGGFSMVYMGYNRDIADFGHSCIKKSEA